MKRGLFFSVICLVSFYAAAKAPDVQVADKTPPMNEMTGTIQSLDADNRVIRLQTDNGFNVEFTYDRDTVCKGVGVTKNVADLAYKDQVIIRYAGKELIAREIETRSLQPAMAASTPTLPAN